MVMDKALKDMAMVIQDKKVLPILIQVTLDMEIIHSRPLSLGLLFEYRPTMMVGSLLMVFDSFVIFSVDVVCYSRLSSSLVG